MQNELLPHAEQYKEKNRRHKLWRKMISGLACVVVFCTIYALTLPAITMERTTYCGMEEHCHGSECYEKRLICGYDENTEPLETSEGYDENTEALETSKGTETYHVHTDDCYEERQELICEQAESTGHVHNESCVQTEQILVCMEDHEHTDDCYQITETYICGLKEGEGAHTHGPECYETQRILTCNLTETEEVPVTPSEIQTVPLESHVHTDECYEEVLICEKPEHKHTLACFSNPEADIESREVWERTMAGVKLTGVWADDLVAIAESQLGYQESTANYTVMDDEKTIKGYSRYGAWYGDSYGDWCAMFVSFCLNYAEIPKTTIPYEASCNRWVEILSKSEWNFYRDADEYIPVKGDLVFFDNNSDSRADHVGIVAEYIDKTAKIKTIEGNYNNRVQNVTYLIDDSKICGYGVLPEKETEKQNLVVLVVEETTKTALIYTDSTYETLLEDETVITLTGLIPQEAEVRAFPVTVESEQQVLCAYDISIVMPDGTLYEPAEGQKINVAIQMPELNADEEALDPTVYYIPEDSAPVPMDTSLEKDGTVSFDTDHFSVYAIMASGTKSVEETTKTALIYTDGTFKTLLEDETVITLSGIIPREAEVRAFPVTVESEQQVLCAYDISIVMPDGTLYEPAEGQKINVAIQTPELNDDETASNTTVYYIPEDSAPVPMDTSLEEDGTVSFDTDHFSVYALMRSGTMPAVYLNGTTGNDADGGTQSAPVKTLERALGLVAQNGTIYVSGTVTVNGTESWSIDVPGVKMQRAAGFTGPLVSVASGGSLTLSDLIMNGGNGGLNPLLISNSSYSTTYSTNFARAPLIVVNTGGSLIVTDGTVLEYNSNKPYMDTNNNNAYYPYGYAGLGGAVYSNGTLTMTGGLIQNCEAQSGGGIYVENGTFDLSGGTIDHNFARNIQSYANSQGVYRTNAGGGVYVGNNSSMTMSGGIVSNNETSREGGGISLGWLNRGWGNAIYSYTTMFSMTGGTFTGNKALSTGGGLNVTAGREATIYAGSFTNNSAYGYDSQGNSIGGYRVYSGGGIYADASQWNSSGAYAGVPGKLILHRVVITQNHSDYQGGGIAACPTGKSNINIIPGNGTAIYNNTSTYNVNNGRSAYQELSIKSETLPIPVYNISPEVLGGGSYNWQIAPVYSSSTGYFTDYGNTLTDSSPEIVTAKSLATVWITNNHGYLGGGIGNNGITEVGGEQNTISISITKVWSDLGALNTNHPDYITVQVLQNGQPYGGPINIYKTINSNNQEIWPTYYLDNLPAGYTYSIAEVTVPGYESEITQAGNNFTITNTLVEYTLPETGGPGAIWYRYTIGGILLIISAILLTSYKQKKRRENTFTSR
ncbi:MAG TPA: Cna B-type domain-containing protein [Clostridiaceae bacterium]|nr:Cna B-type domain-containing protein [Clostridiaceae bacterium]